MGGFLTTTCHKGYHRRWGIPYDPYTHQRATLYPNQNIYANIFPISIVE